MNHCFEAPNHFPCLSQWRKNYSYILVQGCLLKGISWNICFCYKMGFVSCSAFNMIFLIHNSPNQIYKETIVNNPFLNSICPLQLVLPTFYNGDSKALEFFSNFASQLPFWPSWPWQPFNNGFDKTFCPVCDSIIYPPLQTVNITAFSTRN